MNTNKMTENKLHVHKSALFLCVHNSFLKKLTLQNFSAVVRAVPPEEIGRGSFAIMSSLSISLMLSLQEKANCDTVSSHNLHLTCESFLFFDFLSVEHLGCLSRKLNQHKTSAVIF
jgi:hypothetical protein